jgi:transcriptional regulator with XRE-family HTH domain
MKKSARLHGASKLAAYLREERISQTALAAHLDISNGHMSDLLSRRSTPSLQLAVRIENLTGIPARDFAEAGR